MKKVLWALLFGLVFAPTTAFAGESGVKSKLGSLWKDYSASENFHLLDNGTSAWCYDFRTKTQLACLTSSFYHKDAFALDWGMATSIEESTNGFPLVGANFKSMEFLAKYEWARNLVRPLGKHATLLKYANIGGWTGYDFDMSRWRYGVYAGLQKHFGNDGE